MTTLPSSVRAAMLIRSFAVQGSWNFETLIGAGFAFTLLPALRFIYGSDGPELNAAVTRHADLFNSHPYLATVAVGSVARLEAEKVEPAVVERFKTALRGSLGSMGDRLIWTCWRPVSLLIGMVLLLLGASWWVAMAVFLATYNLLHFMVRFLGLKVGIEAGLEVGRVLREAPLQGVIDRASRLGGVVAGAGVILVIAPRLDDVFATVLAIVAIALGSVLGFRTRRVMVAILMVAAVLGIVFGLAGYGA